MIPAFNTVLVVTDFSDLANHAIPFAYSVAAPAGRVHLLHVIEHGTVPNPMYAHYSPDDLAMPEQQERAKAEMAKRLQALQPPDMAGRQTTVQCILNANVPQGILEVAAEIGAEALVIASHGRTGLGHLLLGSVAEEVLHGSRIPVLIVPRADKEV